MEIEMCIRCKERPVHNKKRGLCQKCYTKDRYAERVRPVANNLSEIDFIKNHFNHNNWVYQPATFRIEDLNYSPDFYDGETNCFIEVISTRQAYHQNKYKYTILKRVFPKLLFEVRKTDGSLLDESGRLDWSGTAQNGA